MSIKWLSSPEFKITFERKEIQDKKFDFLMIVEPDEGLSEDVVKVITAPPFNFVGKQLGYWVTKSFIDTENMKLRMTDFARALKSANIPISVIEIEASDLRAIRDEAVKRDFQPNSKLAKFKKEEAKLLSINTQGEDVYTNDSGERALFIDGKFYLASDAPAEEYTRYLIAGDIDLNQIRIDFEFAESFISQQIKRLTRGAHWTVDNTVDSLNILLRTDIADQADNISGVINTIHSALNKSIINQYMSELSKDAIKTYGDIKALRNANAAYVRLLPNLSEDGDEIILNAAPGVLYAAMRYKDSGMNMFALSADSLSDIQETINTKEFGDKIIAAYEVHSNKITSDEKELLDTLQGGAEILSIFDVVNSSLVGTNDNVRYVCLRKVAEPDKTARQLPDSVKRCSSFPDIVSMISLSIESLEILPFKEQELDNLILKEMNSKLKEVPFEPITKFGTMPNQYVVPANLAGPQKKAMLDFVEEFGQDPAYYLVDKLQLTIEKINEVFSKGQIEQVALAISRYEKGLGHVLGGGTGTGKTRIMAAVMRYQALRNKLEGGVLSSDNRIFFVTPEKSLLPALWSQIKLLDADTLINPLVTTHEMVDDENGDPVVFANGETSRTHNLLLKRVIKDKLEIPDRYNAIFTTYRTVSARPEIREALEGDYHSLDKVVMSKQIAKRAKKSEKPKDPTANKKQKTIYVREYDAVLAFSNFCDGRAVFVADESHSATGQSNTKAAIKLIQDSCNGRIHASATAIKNAERTEIYADAMRVKMSNSQLVEVLKVGGEVALEAFASSLTEEGAYYRTEMPTSEILVSKHTDNENVGHYEHLNDAYAEIMNKYLQMIKYINKAKDVHYNTYLSSVDPEKFKPRAAEDISIGLNTTGFNSRFTKTNELFVACIKAHYVAQEAVEVIRSGGKVVIPLELTSETNMKYIADLYDYPMFSERQIQTGALDQWIEEQKNRDPNFEGVNFYFKDVLLRMLEASKQLKVKKIDEKDGKTEIEVEISADELIAEMLSYEEVMEFNNLQAEFKDKAQLFPKVTASPFDEIINQIRKAGYSAEAYCGRHLEIKYHQASGLPYLAASNLRKVSEVRERYMADEIDCVVMGRSGWTGVEWHATGNKPATMIFMVPPTSADLEKQLCGRIHRTGQNFAPNFLYTSTGLLVEERLIQQSVQRMRNLNATSQGNANMNANSDEIKLFSPVGVEAVKRYLYNNLDVLKEVGFEQADIESNFSGNASIATALTARVQMLSTKRSKEIMNGIAMWYNEYVNELVASGFDPFGDELLDVDATIKCRFKIGGVESDNNPWTSPVYVSVVEYSEQRKTQSSADIARAIQEASVGDVEFADDVYPYKINSFAAKERCEEFSKMMLNNASSTLKSISAMTSAELKDIPESSGVLYSMKKRYERDMEFSSLLSGMKVGQIVSLLTNPNDPASIAEGVVTDVVMERTSGLSCVLYIDIPGHDQKRCTSITAQNLNINKTPLMFDKNSALGQKFDNQRTVNLRNRLILTGSAFPMITMANDVLKAHNIPSRNNCKVANMTFAKDGLKTIDKVLLLPHGVTLESMMSKGAPLSALEATHYIDFAGSHVSTLYTGPNRTELKESDLTLHVMDKDNGNTVIRIVSNRKNKDLVSDADFNALGNGADGTPGFCNVDHTKNAAIIVKGKNIYKVLELLDDKYGKRFFCDSFGLKFIEDFKSANLPSDYTQWRSEAYEAFKNNLNDTMLGNNIDVNNLLEDLQEDSHLNQLTI